MGEMKNCPSSLGEIIDASGKFVLPTFVDSHTHLVFPASREQEFTRKILGATYAEIAASGGGILNTAKKLKDISEEELLIKSISRANQVLSWGTSTIEIKSGYGLSLDGELKMLRVASKLREETPLKIKTTFLGAHAVPKGSSKRDYIRLVKEEMIPAVASENLATFIDVFCETGFFTEDESVDILETGKKYGLVPKVHANQLNLSGGVQAGIKTGAISVDHLETVSDTELSLLENSKVIPTLLPGAAFFLRSDYPPARKMIELGLPITVASDFNPGSSPTGNMQVIWSLACIGMKMTPSEAFNAITLNGAYAMQMESISGIIASGRSADLIITKDVPSFDYIPYSYGEDCFEKIMINGSWIDRNLPK